MKNIPVSSLNRAVEVAETQRRLTQKNKDAALEQLLRIRLILARSKPLTK